MVWGKKKNQEEWSYFGTNVTLEGRLCFSGVIRLDGRVNGDIVSSGTLIVAETAVITGNILVESLVLNGTVYGNIRAFKHAQLNSVSKVYGHISYGAFSLEGAMHEGSSHKLTDDEIEKARQECFEILDDSSRNADKSKPNEAALEQYTSSVAVSAEKQTNALLGKKQETAGHNKKQYGHQGRSAQSAKHAAAAAVKIKDSADDSGNEGGKNVPKATARKEQPAAKSASEADISGKSEPGGNGNMKTAIPANSWDSLKNTNIPIKTEADLPANAVKEANK